MRCLAREWWISPGGCSGEASMVLVVCGVMLPLCSAHMIVPDDSTVFTVSAGGHPYSGHGALRPLAQGDEDLLEVQEVLLS